MFLLSAGSPMDPPLGSMPLNPLMRRRRCGGYRLVTRPGGRPAALSQPTQVRPEGCKQGQRGWAAFPPHLGGLGVCLPLGEGGVTQRDSPNTWLWGLYSYGRRPRVESSCAPSFRGQGWPPPPPHHSSDAACCFL